MSARAGPELAVVGVGAVGGAVAAALRAAGHAPRLCSRSGFARLEVDWPAGRDGATVEVATRPAAGARPADWVLLATRAHQTPGAGAWLRALCRAGTRVAVLQEGVEHEARVAAWVAGAEVLPVVVQLAAERPAPGRVRVEAPGALLVPEGEAGRDFAALFHGAPLAVACVEDFTSAAWRALCPRLAEGAIPALADRALGVFREPEIAELACRVVAEGMQVARAVGARLDAGLAGQVAEALAAREPDRVPAMLADWRAGRPLELDACNGAVVRIGASHRVATPLNHALLALLQARAAGPASPGAAGA